MSDQQHPLVSIIMPVYNRHDYIQRAIESILNQNYSEWELIAIDDGSEDSSAYLIELYKARSSKIKVLYQSHRGLSAARNNGIKNAVGEVITFLDSDDELTQDHLQLRVDYLYQNPDVDFLHGGVKIIGNEFVPDKYDPEKLIHLSQCTIGATFFGRRSVFEKLKGFSDLSYSEDSEFLERVEQYFKVKKVDFPTYIYHRETPDSITNTIRYKRWTVK